MTKKVDIDVSGGSVRIGNIAQGSRNKLDTAFSSSYSENPETTDRGADEYDVFISYSHKDEAIAKEVANKIKAHNIRCFLASDEMIAGENFAEVIKSALNSAPEFWIIISKNSLQSEWVTTEWGGAWAMGKHIIPILWKCDSTGLPDRMAVLQSIDANDIENSIPSLRKRIKGAER
jgi:hypothetical protein